MRWHTSLCNRVTYWFCYLYACMIVAVCRVLLKYLL
nr:MAG TPA: hypothetical protein [Caudoviricetes sp.]